MTLATTAHPTGPYTDFNFVLMVDGTTLGGFADATGLLAVTDLPDHPDGNAATTPVRTLPGLGQFDTATLKRGLADAILDRLVHHSHRIELKGESMRKRPVTLTDRERIK